MGSEVFNLKSFYLEDTVVRGARISSKNARTTRTIEVNPGDDPTVKTGETGINKEYLIQSSLSGNDIKGYGTFTNNSDVIRNYTGAQNLEYSDKIRLNGEKTFYTITGIDGTDVYLVERYQKEDITGPDNSSGVCDIRKIKLDSVKYEYSNQNIIYNKDSSEWGVTGIQMSESVVAPSNTFEFDTGMKLKFKSGVSNNESDIATVQSEYKTLIDNNTSPIYDVSLNPIPFPHDSLQVYIGKYGEVPQKAIEYEDYAINYSSTPELRYPIPPFEERDVAYIKFLGFMVDEEQITEINSDYEGRFTIIKREQEESVLVQKPLQEIIPTDDFSIKVGGIEKENNFNYIVDNEAGIVNTISHNNSEFLIDVITTPKKLIWDGISVIKGIKQNEVININDLIIPPVEGLKGINYPVCFEDTDLNNLLRDIDFIIDPESGAFTLTSPLKEDESVLVSFYVEGNDIENEKIDLNTLRLKSFPVIVDSLILNQKYTEINDEGNEITRTRIMEEGIDYTVSYVTGYLSIINLSQISKEIIASYTPMTQVNCVAQSIPGDDINFRYTIIDDVLSFEQDNEGSKQLIFKVNNPIISIPKKIIFDEDKTDGNYTFTSTILPEDILELKTITDSKIFNIEGAFYNDLTKIITLDESVNKITPVDGETVVSSYSYVSDILPYAPILLLYTIINAGNNSFDIEGYDKTDVLRSETVFRIDNNDPVSTNYFLIKNVSYNNEKTTVEIYGTFSEDVRDPDFYLFDDQITWKDLSSDVIVDTTIPIGSEQIKFTGNILFVHTNIKSGTLLLVNNQEIYSVTGLTINGGEAIVEIYPALKSSITSYVKFSRLPIYNEGDINLNTNQFILNDPEQPAFTLWYKSPVGFDGSAKIIFIENIITIEETVSGIKNTKPYIFNTNDYTDIYALAKAIQSTPSTYNLNISNSGVPEYYPFTILHNNKEQYYLGEGIWNPESMISFEEETFVSLPYTFKITPELYKWSLLELYKNSDEFTIYNYNRTPFFKPGMVLFFNNRISGRLFFTSVKGSYLSNGTDTVVELTNLITENMINPVLNVYYNPEWEDLYNELLSIDYNSNVLTISGKPTQDLKTNSLLYIGFEYVFQVNTITEFSGYFTIKLNSNIPNEVSVQSYAGYIKYSSNPVSLAGLGDQWLYVGNLNEKKLEIDIDYTIDNGSVVLTTPIESKDRFKINYMGLNTFVENEGESITCTCRFLSYLPEGYRVDVYMDYLNIDQFYFQKLTERKFGEIVLTPQIEEFLDQLGSGGQGTDSGATNDSVPNYEGGLVNLEYSLQDENIKKQLYLRIYHWYKQRLRSLSAELQLDMGFKFAHSTQIGEVGNYYSIEDVYVEGNDYFLTTDEDINQIENGFSKFFPIGYNDQAPAYYNQFGTDYLSFNEVYGCNIKYINNEGNIVTKGIIKSDRPYWNKTSDLIFQVWSDYSIANNNNLVGHYYVDVPEKDRVLPPSEFSFLRVIEIGDKIKLNGFKNYYTISEIVSSEIKDYEYIVTDKIISDKGIDYFDLLSLGKSFEEFMDALPADSMRMLISRQNKENFPMSDSYGSLGATAYGDKPKGHVINTRRIKKRFAVKLLNLLFPISIDTEPTKIFSIYVKKDSEEPWEKIGDIDLSKLTFKEERDVDDIMDGLRYDFEEKFSLPTYTWYDITQDDNKGFHRYFYLSFEKIYDADENQGYYEGIVIRAKNRNWWFKIQDSGERPIVGDLGYAQSIEYKNFYDPENIYKKMLIEKQAWETEELIIRDLYDFNDKIARAFYQGNMNVINSLFRDYLAKPDGSNINGISDILKIRIPAYEKQLRFLTDPVGPVYRILYPDFIHAENNATPEIAVTYNQTQQALSIYTTSYYKMLFYNILNRDNNEAWKNNYVKWIMSLERGVIYQSLAKDMFEYNARVLTVGLEEIPVMRINLINQGFFTITDSLISISSTYYGKYINITFSLTKNSTQTVIPSQSVMFYLYTEEIVGGINTIIDKTINQVVSEISNYEYDGVKLFTASNIFNHYENNVTSKFVNLINAPLTISGITINCSNVADHRSSDPRILYINRQIEDRIYTHEIRSVPGFNIKYIGNFYNLEYSQVSFKLSLLNSNNYCIDYQCFIDERNKKSMRIWSNQYDPPLILTLYFLDENGEFLRYKTFNEYISEINSIDNDSFSNIHAELIYSNGALSCGLIIENNYNVYGNENSSVEVYFTVENIENDIAYYRVISRDNNSKKLEILYYKLIKDGSIYKRTDEVEKIFEFSFNNLDGSYKTIEELCSEISEYNYRGDLLFNALSIYSPEPKEDLYTNYVVLNDEYLPIDQDSGSKIYVDTYVETLGNTEYSSRNISELKNAVFSFPMYTANGNPNKLAIEDIPVSGEWEETKDKDVIKLECKDGDSWEVTFSDTSNEDYKSYMAPQEIIDLINEGQTLTQEQYAQIQIIEDRPSVPVIKELILIRKSGSIKNEFHINLRQYNTLFNLVDAISKATFNKDGNYDLEGNRKFFNATLIGDSNVEGQYKSYELESYYNPVIKSFSVEDPKPGYPNNISYKNNHVIGWEMAIEKLEITEAYNLKMSSKRYSPNSTYKFTMNPPEQAYIDTLYNNPQGFRRDILAFDIYSWDLLAQYEIRDNWIYLKSASVDYSSDYDLGQPNKNLGYGIPLAGSGHSSTSDDESLLDLVNRINSNTIVNKWFYANIKFTRNDKVNPGYFEYNYLPNFSSSIPKSSIDFIMLRDDNVMNIRPGQGYSFTSSNITIDYSAKTMNLSCDWRYPYVYERTLLFSDPGNTTLGDLENSINNMSPPYFSLSLSEANVLPTFSSTLSSLLIPTLVDKSLTTSYTDIKVNTGSGQVSAFQVKLRSTSGAFFEITNAKFKIPISRDRITFSCIINYFNNFSISSYDLSTKTLGDLYQFLSNVTDYSYTLFGPLFRLEIYSEVYETLNAYRLLNINSSINIGGTELYAYLRDVIGIKMLNMYNAGTVNINNFDITITTFKIFNSDLPNDKNIHGWVDNNSGDITSGILSCYVLPIKITAIDRGNLAIAEYTLTTNNQPAHVYFGVMGDIKFIQISDYNLHTQYNYIKDRLGKPWKDEQGNIIYDYYTPETYNENNPYAINFDNFLGYLRTTRYNQIKNSIINEALVQNNYFWLYMKFHKEFGCDQRVITLQNQIEKREENIDLLNGIL